MNQSAHEAGDMMPLRIVKITDAAVGIRSFELARDDGVPLPAFTAGSHVRVRVPNGELRKYSLCNDPAERGRYVITVKRDAQGRGARSAWSTRRAKAMCCPPPSRTMRLRWSTIPAA